jgi:hypothetical protein
MIDNITHLAPQWCLCCGAKITAAAEIEDLPVTPEPGNYNICLHCCHIHVYGDNYRLREPTAEEFAEAIANPEVQKTLVFAKTFQAFRDVNAAIGVSSLTNELLLATDPAETAPQSKPPFEGETPPSPREQKSNKRERITKHRRK